MVERRERGIIGIVFARRAGDACVAHTNVAATQEVLWSPMT